MNDEDLFQHDAVSVGEFVVIAARHNI